MTLDIKYIYHDHTLNLEISFTTVVPTSSNSEHRTEKERTGEILARYHLLYHIIKPFPKIYRVRFSFCRLIPRGRVMSVT